MGRKIELLKKIRGKINKLRNLEYYIQENEVEDESLDAVEDILDHMISDDVFELIDIDIQERKAVEDWGTVKLRTLAKKLRIPHWGRMARPDLIFQIKNRSEDIRLYFPSFIYEPVEEEEKKEDGDSSETTTKTTQDSKRHRDKKRIEELRLKISRPFEHGSTFGRI